MNPSAWRGRWERQEGGKLKWICAEGFPALRLT